MSIFRRRRSSSAVLPDSTEADVLAMPAALRSVVLDVDGVPVVAVPVRGTIAELVAAAEAAGRAAEMAVRRAQLRRPRGPRHAARDRAALTAATQQFRQIAAAEGHPVTELGPREDDIIRSRRLAGVWEHAI